MTTTLARTYQEIRWADDMDPNGAETDSDLESLEQDVLHLIVQRVGSNLADPTKGAGALDYLSGPASRLERLPAVLDAQLAAVTRIASSRSTLTVETDGTYRLDVEIAVGPAVLAIAFAVGADGVKRI